MTAEKEHSQLSLISPTTAIALEACRQRVAFGLDRSLSALRRPGLRSVMGVVAHAVSEQLSRDRGSMATPEQAKAWFASAWDRALSWNEGRLRRAWAPAAPPPSHDWPGYALTRARLEARATATLQAASKSPPRITAPASGGLHPGALPWVERRLIDPERRIVGTPDLVEQREDGICVVDIKSGVSPLEVTPQRTLQLLIYAHLVAVHGLPQPRRGELVSPSGKSLSVELAPYDVAAAVERICRIRDEYNALIESGGTIDNMASPSPETCRGCPYRVICPSFADLWHQGWNVSRGAFGKLESLFERGDRWEANVLVTSPRDLKARLVRVTEIPGRPTVAVGEQFNTLGTDVMGEPTVQRARWSTVYWPPLQRDIQQG